jgi:hypothetical protein
VPHLVRLVGRRQGAADRPLGAELGVGVDQPYAGPDRRVEGSDARRRVLVWPKPARDKGAGAEAQPIRSERVNAYRAVVNNYGGPLAEGMSTLAWIEPAREAIRRDAIDAVAALARALVEDDPQQTLDLLEIARAFDPHNELLYRDIMRLQERLGQLDAIPRTLALLTTRLAEIDRQPSPQTRELAARLAQRHERDPLENPASTRAVRPGVGERGHHRGPA